MEVRNRFRGLDLIDRVPDELWTEVCDIDTMSYIGDRNQDHRQEKEMQKKAKWLSEEALQIAMKEGKQKAKEKRKDISI